MMIAGWMGGTLVHRNQIGVDIRYANAGKWKEVYVDLDKGEVEVGKQNDLEINQMKLIHLKGKRIVLGKTETGYVAFDDRCTHKGGSLAGGSMMCNTVQCPWHGSQFDVKSGLLKAGPAKVGIKTYEVIERAGKVFVLVV
jgi:nitrite reductase/ring-hydroxylating ferredoxin subunit